MARAISPHARFSLQLIEAPVKRGLDQSGSVVEYQDGKPVIAQFSQTGLQDWEQLAALEHFNFSGLAEGVNPLSTISVWDSEAHALSNGWDEEFHAKVEARLRHLATQHPASVLVVDAPLKPSPWGKYDQQDVQTIFSLYEATGADPEVVRLYEYENQARPEILDAMERIQAGEATIEDFLTTAVPDGNDPVSDQATYPGIPAAPIVEGVVSTVSVAPAKTDPFAAARAAKAAKAAAKQEDVIVDA